MRFSFLLLAGMAILIGPASASVSPIREIRPNTMVGWDGTTGPGIFRAAGITVTAASKEPRCPDVCDDAVPVFTVSAAGIVPLRIEQPDSTAHGWIGIGVLNKGQRPSAVIADWTGGAHCCAHIRVATPIGREFRVVDLGKWDGDGPAWPRDVSGDGVGDFVMVDNAFLYKFGCYACSYAPPQIINVRAGKRTDVSAERQFAGLFKKDMAVVRPVCIKHDVAACAAFAADSARLGRFAANWPIVAKALANKDDLLGIRVFLRERGYIR